MADKTGGLSVMDEVRPPSHLIKDSLASGGGILCVGLPRTGTFSLATAIEKLGYDYVHHVIRFARIPQQWKTIEDCAVAHMPHLNKYGTTKPWTKQQWDDWLGQFQATTDITPFYAKELIKMYPGAKVILVERPYDKWITSMNTTLFYFVFSWIYYVDGFVDWVSGHHSSIALHRAISGFFSADTTAEAMANGRKVYDDYHTMIRRLVPKENLLEYKMGDGWEPLCEFLDKPVPNEPFPRANEAAWLLKARYETRILKSLLGVFKAVKLMSPLLLLGIGYKIGTSYPEVPTSMWQSVASNFTSVAREL